jgi:hypothetical protein
MQIKRLRHFRSMKFPELEQIFPHDPGSRRRIYFAKVCGSVIRAPFYIGTGVNGYIAELGYSRVKIAVSLSLSRSAAWYPRPVTGEQGRCLLLCAPENGIHRMLSEAIGRFSIEKCVSIAITQSPARGQFNCLR